MGLFDALLTSLKSIAGRKKEFDELLAQKDISAIIEQMTTRHDLIIDAQKDYDTMQHPVNFRDPKLITDKDGRLVRKEEVWKIPVPYPVYINEIALVFLYGRPVKWSKKSDGTENAWAAFQKVIKDTRFDAKVRQCKRLAGAETESAMLFRVYKDTETGADGRTAETPKVQIRVLAKSKGDDIRVRWDQYENIISIGWGYYVKEDNDNTNYHFDIFTPAVIYRCRRVARGWEVTEEQNPVGKIPIILFQQEKEWAGTEKMLYRLESVASRTADTNDYFADPIAVMDADVIKNMPEKQAANKLLIAKGIRDGGVDKVAKYLTWDNAPQSKKDEVEWLENKIHTMSFTPNISFETLKSVSQLSAKALKTVMLLADIKASKRKESHDELLDRTASLIAAIIGNVLDVSLADECRRLVVEHEFQEPFGEDVAEALSNIVKAYDAGIMSMETAVVTNPLIKDGHAEFQKVEKEADERAERQKDLFSATQDTGDIMGTSE